jgi:hypothetical protein
MLGRTMRAAAAVLAVLLLLALPAGAAQPRRATLKLAGLAPLRVDARGFGAGERVVLTASAAGVQRMAAVVARKQGSFTAQFDLRLGRCAPLTVRAVGERGSRAVLQVHPRCDKKEKRRA